MSEKPDCQHEQMMAADYTLPDEAQVRLTAGQVRGLLTCIALQGPGATHDRLKELCPQAFSRQPPEKPQPLPFMGNYCRFTTNDRLQLDQRQEMTGARIAWRLEYDYVTDDHVLRAYPADQLIAYEQARQEPQK